MRAEVVAVTRTRVSQEAARKEHGQEGISRPEGSGYADGETSDLCKLSFIKIIFGYAYMPAPQNPNDMTQIPLRDLG